MTAILAVESGLVERHPTLITSELEQLLNKVEYYQPLYGVSGIEDPLRPCRDRAIHIASALAPLGEQFRLIDFGSSLGYFPFFFADRGAICTGLDIKPENTAVARGVQHLNGLNATFGTASLDMQTVHSISPGEYDVALMLSVLHHIHHRHGTDYVARLLADLLDRIPMLILELATKDEAVRFAWRESLPADPLAILSACGNINVRKLGLARSHLSDSERPIYVISSAEIPCQSPCSPQGLQGCGPGYGFQTVRA
jgi:O-antigen chain-terminating methyltransferase